MSRVSEGRISALAHLILTELKGAAGADFRNERVILQEIKGVLGAHLRVDEALDARVRRKITSLSRHVPEGSGEWDVLYRQYFEEEKRKLGR